MIDLYGLAWRRDDNSHLGGWNGDGDGGACRDIRIGDRCGDQRDRGWIRNLRRRGVGHEAAGRGGSAGNRAARIHCAVRSGNAPAHSFVLLIILHGGREILGVAWLEGYGRRCEGYGNGGLGGRYNGGWRVATWRGRGVRASV